ncbi:MAG: GNAT family N-acetyltransferase [Calditrichaeota bacterium]|nr:MAG: GNAT family N-acetyltransferase [Calditrichota bacterium]
MQPSDLQQANGLISRAFSQGRIDDGYAITDVPMCRPDFLAMYLQQCPQGCFVYKEVGQLRGAAFCHIWGKTGWFGPLAVAPERHHLGIGKQLLHTCIEFLQTAGCKTIGLETNPRSSRNIGFYGKSGFVPSVLSIDMIKPVPSKLINSDEQPHSTIRYSTLSLNGKKEFRFQIWNLMQMAGNGTDYTNLIESIDSFKLGESLLFRRKDTSIGFAVLQTKPTQVEEQNALLRIIAFYAHPQTPDNYFPYFFTDILSMAQILKLDRVLLRLPAYSPRTFELLLNQNFRVISSDLRLTLKGYPEIIAPHFHLNRWV